MRHHATLHDRCTRLHSTSAQIHAGMIRCARNGRQMNPRTPDLTSQVQLTYVRGPVGQLRHCHWTVPRTLRLQLLPDPQAASRHHLHSSDGPWTACRLSCCLPEETRSSHESFDLRRKVKSSCSAKYQHRGLPRASKGQALGMQGNNKEMLLIQFLISLHRLCPI